MQGWVYEGWLADDGEHFVGGYHGMNLIPRKFPRDLTMLRFYANGKLFKRVGLNEIVQDQSKLQETASHYYWGNFCGRDEKGRIIVYTVEENALFYDAATGDLLERRNITNDEFLESALMTQAEKEHETTLLRIPPHADSKQGDYYCSLQLPLGYVVEKAEGEDFDIYTIGTDGLNLIGVHIGSHPDFPLEPADGSEITDMDICSDALQEGEIEPSMTGVSVSEFKLRNWWKDGKTVHRELLVYPEPGQPSVTLLRPRLDTQVVAGRATTDRGKDLVFIEGTAVSPIAELARLPEGWIIARPS